MVTWAKPVQLSGIPCGSLSKTDRLKADRHSTRPSRQKTSQDVSRGAQPPIEQGRVCQRRGRQSRSAFRLQKSAFCDELRHTCVNPRLLEIYILSHCLAALFWSQMKDFGSWENILGNGVIYRHFKQDIEFIKISSKLASYVRILVQISSPYRQLKSANKYA